MAALAKAWSGEWTDELVVAGPEGARYDETGDGKHVLWVEDAGNGFVRTAWDGNVSRPFQLVNQADGNFFVFSPGNLHIAWFGGRADNDFFVAVDGVEYPCEGVTRSVPPTWSADGTHLTFGIITGNRTRLIVDGQPYGDWHPAPVRPVFSRDGSRLAFVAETRELRKGEREGDYRQWVVLDGVAQPEVERISTNETGLQFSPDGRQFLYLAMTAGQESLVVDGAVRDRAPLLAFPTWSPDGRRLVYGAGSKDALVVRGDGIGAGRTFQSIALPVFSADSSRVAYAGMSNKRLTVVVDGVESPEMSDAWGNLVFSPDSRHVAYLAGRKSGGFLSRSSTWHLVRDGVVGSAWDEVTSSPHFSPDSAHVAFSARRGKDWFVAVDDTPGMAAEQASPPRYGATGRVGYLAGIRNEQGGRQYRVVVDGVAGQVVNEPAAARFDEPFLFSPDGEHVVAAGRIDHWWRPIVDDTVGPGGLGVGDARFDGDLVSFLVTAGDGAHRVTTQLRGR
jgi:WD40-like Beta Propeller Repeat